jgi:hypothetical protein
MKRKKPDRDLFDQQLSKVHNDYIGPAIKEAIEQANADLKPPQSVILHAILRRGVQRVYGGRAR